MFAPQRSRRIAKPRGGSAPRAFTLVESAVLVSLALAALMVLAPALGAVRERDKLAECLANLRTIGRAGLTYASEDPNEIMIPVPRTDVLSYASGTFEWGGKSGRGQSPAAPANPDYGLSVFGTGAYRGPAHRPLNPYLYKGGFVDYNPPDGVPDPGPGYLNWVNDANLDLGLYRCPADTGYAGGGFLYTSGLWGDRNERAFRDEGLTAYDHYGNSYAANTFWITGGLAGALLSSVSVYLQPLSQVPSPAHSIAYQEVPSRFVWLWGEWDGSGCEWANFEEYADGNFNAVPGWHGRDFHFSVGFADGRAAFVKMQGTIRPAPHLGPDNYPPDGCGGGVDDYLCWQCVTHRGPGWQLDTLPAPPVLTPFFGDRSDGASPGSARSGPSSSSHGPAGGV